MRPDKQTVLIVDDEREIRSVCQRMLCQAGYLCLVAQGVFEAMQTCRNYPDQIDLLVADFSLPGGLDGRQLARHLTTIHPNLKPFISPGCPKSS